MPWKEWSTKNPPEFLSTADRSRDDKGDLYLEPKEFSSPIVLGIVLLKYISQFLHSSNKGRRYLSHRYPTLCQRMSALTYVPQISTIWASLCAFLALCPYGKTFRFPTASPPLVLYCILPAYRASYYRAFSYSGNDPFRKEEEDGERR